MDALNFRLCAAFGLAVLILVALTVLATSKPNKHTRDVVTALITTLGVVVTFLACSASDGD